MPTLRDEFHQLGNWHNKISMGAITTRESLSDANILKLPPEELGKIIEKAAIVLKKIEGYVQGADKTVEGIKPFVYEKLGADTDISAVKS